MYSARAQYELPEMPDETYSLEEVDEQTLEYAHCLFKSSLFRSSFLTHALSTVCSIFSHSILDPNPHLASWCPADRSGAHFDIHRLHCQAGWLFPSYPICASFSEVVLDVGTSPESFLGTKPTAGWIYGRSSRKESQDVGLAADSDAADSDDTGNYL